MNGVIVIIRRRALPRTRAVIVALIRHSPTTLPGAKKIERLPVLPRCVPTIIEGALFRVRYIPHAQ